MKFKIEYEGWDGGYWLLFIRRRFLFFRWWHRISASHDLEFTKSIRDKLIKENESQKQ